MPKVQAAVLSDVAYVRDGLVYLLAGGINRVTTGLPGTLNVSLTIMVELEGETDPLQIAMKVTAVAPTTLTLYHRSFASVRSLS